MEELYYQVQKIQANYKICLMTTEDKWNCTRILNDELVHVTKHAQKVAQYRCWDQFKSDSVCNAVPLRVLKIVSPYYDQEFDKMSLQEALK